MSAVVLARPIGEDRRVEIRRAVPDDAAGIADLHVRSWQSGYRGQLPDELLDSLDPAHRLPRWTAALEQPGWPRQGTLVADDGHELVGFAHLCPSRDEGEDQAVVGEITSFYVSPDRWRTGIGRQLMSASLETLTGAGYAGASLWVLDTNARAIRFYEATGWHTDGAVKAADMAGVPIREARYRHELAHGPTGTTCH